MTLDRTERRKVAPFSLSSVVALLALAVMLVGVFAIHSEVAGHEGHTPGPVSSAEAGPLDATLGMAAVAMVAPAAVLMSSDAHDGSLDCALLAVACVLLLVLVALVFLTRRPAVFRRLLDAGGIALGLLRATASPIRRPSLTLLSISRV